MGLQHFPNPVAFLSSHLPLYGKIIETDYPENLKLDVPYIAQETPHGSGAACARMLLELFGFASDDEATALSGLRIANPSDLKHESFEETLSQYLLTKGLLPGHYAPAAFINPVIDDGVLATDFIRSNMHAIADHDHKIFRLLLAKLSVPQLIRLHFTTDIYPMPESVARWLDVSGHCILLVGYDSTGFLVHDPWDVNRWGGERGGPYTHISFDELKRGRSSAVNMSRDFVGTHTRPLCYFEPLPLAIVPNRDVIATLVVQWPGIGDVHARRWFIDNISVRLSAKGAIGLPSSPVTLSGLNLCPGQEQRIEIPINTGSELGSSQINADICLTIISPRFPWIIEDMPSSDEIMVGASYRIAVQDVGLFQKYGRL